MDKTTKGIIIGASVGVLAGAIAGILFAPQSGKETREDIKKYLHEIKEKIAEELSLVGDITKEKYDEVVGKVVKIYETEKKITSEDATDIKDKLKNNYHEVVKIATEKTDKK
ncbi:MAG: YtxH domain-containing protein [Patescibacteria group bacterium]